MPIDFLFKICTHILFSRTSFRKPIIRPSHTRQTFASFDSPKAAPLRSAQPVQKVTTKATVLEKPAPRSSQQQKQQFPRRDPLQKILQRNILADIHSNPSFQELGDKIKPHFDRFVEASDHAPVIAEVAEDQVEKVPAANGDIYNSQKEGLDFEEDESAHDGQVSESRAGSGAASDYTSSASAGSPFNLARFSAGVGGPREAKVAASPFNRNMTPLFAAHYHMSK